MHDAGLAPGHSAAGDGRRHVGAARDEAVALLARAGMPPPRQCPPDRMDPQADPFAPLLHALASPPAGSPGAGMGAGAGAAAGAGDPGTVRASRPRA